MSDDDTIDEDLACAKEMLTKEREDATAGTPLSTLPVIFGADLYVAFRLLESFVAEIERLRTDNAQWREHAEAHAEERRRQFAMLMEIRHLCDQAIGVDRTKGDAREPGALGAVKALVGRYTELVEAIRNAD
jgi:hypothetical protein